MQLLKEAFELLDVDSSGEMDVAGKTLQFDSIKGTVA